MSDKSVAEFLHGWYVPCCVKFNIKNRRSYLMLYGTLVSVLHGTLVGAETMVDLINIQVSSLQLTFYGDPTPSQS